MWADLNINDNSSLEKFYSIHREMSEYYKERFSPEKIKSVFITKADQNIRGFIYDDGTHLITLVVKKSWGRDGLHILTCGTDKIPEDMDVVASITHDKVQELMRLEDFDEAWGVWSDTIGDNYEVGELFIESFCRRCANTNGEAYGYSSSTKEMHQGKKSVRGILSMRL